MKCKDCGCEHEPPVVSLFDIAVCYKALKKRVEELERLLRDEQDEVQMKSICITESIRTEKELESRATTAEKRVGELIEAWKHTLTYRLEDFDSAYDNFNSVVYRIDKEITTTKGAEG